MEPFTIGRRGDWISEPAIEAHRAPDLPVPVDDPMPDPQPGHPHTPNPLEQDDPVPDHKPEVGFEHFGSTSGTADRRLFL